MQIQVSGTGSLRFSNGAIVAPILSKEINGQTMMLTLKNDCPDQVVNALVNRVVLHDDTGIIIDQRAALPRYLEIGGPGTQFIQGKCALDIEDKNTWDRVTSTFSEELGRITNNCVDLEGKGTVFFENGMFFGVNCLLRSDVGDWDDYDDNEMDVYLDGTESCVHNGHPHKQLTLVTLHRDANLIVARGWSPATFVIEHSRLMFRRDDTLRFSFV